MLQRMRSPVLVAAVLAAFVATTCGCGYILYPDRRHNVPSRDLDTKVVVMDCLWLLVCVVPGVVALAVDFTNQTAFYSVGETTAVPGDRLHVRIHGQAPVECEVTVRCVVGAGRDLAPAVRAMAVAGRPLGELALTIPPEARPGDAAVVLAVDGHEQVRWAVGPAGEGRP
jgi:hypothetical protein